MATEVRPFPVVEVGGAAQLVAIAPRLASVDLLWLTALVILYFPCRWWAECKRTHRAWWVSYL
ncbi:MAG TPA: hypothetical protein VFA60_15665 [Terriglobales bacterium]|nr:hypothetical protein [Terriglobales bacterium]